ncbi:MAG: hypothetical protein MUE54_01660 [Anaerolineae bacterium]|nr:hypothetical protein [Anaerolineae bacterium]
MIQITFNIRMDDDQTPDSPLFDEFELAQMLDHTKAQITQFLQTRLGDLRCPSHDQLASVRVDGAYNTDTEQLDFNYHIDTCCQMFLMQAIAALNRSS